MLRLGRPRTQVNRLRREAALLLVAAALAGPEGAQALDARLGHGARLAFTRDGFAVSERGETEGGWRFELLLRSYGRGAKMRRVATAEKPTDGARLEYRHGPLTEWYVNLGPAIEQGFTLSEKPEGSGPLALHFELRTDIAPALSSDARSLAFAVPTGARLRYSELAAFDAHGRSLPARFVLDPGRLMLEVDDRGAVYRTSSPKPVFSRDVT